MKQLIRPLILWLIAGLFLAFPVSLIAQDAVSDEEQVEQVIQDLFDAMREGDSAVARSLFMPGATMGRAAFDQEGSARLRTGGSIDGWIKAIGTPHEKVFDEKIYNLRISVDPPLANAWMDFKFFLGDTFSHCGVNNFMLFKSPDGWKIISVIDTNRKTECAE